MGKVLKPILMVAAVAVNAFPVVGQVVSAGILAATGATIGAAAALTATSAVLGLAAGAIKTGARAGSSLSGFDPKAINIDPATKRKMVFGRTAFPLDMRYGEPSGTNQEYIDYVFALAAHRSDGIEEIWIEDKQAWTLAGGAQGAYAGYLTVEIILEGGSGAFHTVNAGTSWGSAQRMTGCTTMKVRVKRSNTTGSTSPFANGIAGRWTVIGRGMPLYDPALDSTVPGGSGTQRPNDCTTWRWSVSSVERGRNPALQLLAYLLGYRINGVVSVGLGMSAALIDLPSFATAAARCDEAVTLVGGGSHRRYEAGRYFADDDDPEGVIATLLAAMNAELFDDGGRIGLRVAVNDLTAAITLTDDDIQSGYSWNPAPPPSEQFTLVRGRFQQPNAPSLFGLADYPDVAVPRTSPSPRPLLLDLSAVQDVRRAERIAKQVGQRSLYVGTFSTRIGIRGWFLRRNMVVAWTSEARNWSAKLFRVRSLRFNIDGTVDCVFREEHADVYQWDNSETGNVSPVTPTTYDPRNAPWITAVASAATTANWSGVVDDGGKPENDATKNTDGGNHIRDPRGFDWTPVDGATVEHLGLAGPIFDSDRARLPPSTAGSIVYFCPQNAEGIRRHAVTPGERFHAALWAYRVVGATTAQMKITLYDAQLTSIATADISGTLINSTTSPAGAWYYLRGFYDIPAGVAYVLPHVAFNGSSSTGDIFVGMPYWGKHQPGADVTGQNTAADTANVAGTPAGTVVSTANTALADAAAAQADAAAAQATADAALAYSIAAVPPKAITALGASAALDVVIPNGESRNFQAIVDFDLATGTRTLTAPMEYRIGSGSWTGFGTADSAVDTGPSRLSIQNTGTISNSSGAAQNYQVRAVVAITGGTGGTVDGNTSFIGPF